MKAVGLCWAGMFCLIFLSGCHGRTEPGEGVAAGETALVVEGEPPKIVFEAETHDFGDVGTGTQNSCEFKFSNQGKGLLKITEVKSTCGCTVVKIDNKECKPGEAGSINVIYSAPATAGSQMRQLNVFSNDPVRPKVDLTLKANVVVRVVFKPQRLNLSLKQEKPDPITITAQDGKAFSIARISSAPSGITADFDPAKKATEFVLVPKIDTEKLRKGLTGYLDIDLTHPESKKIQIPFSILAKYQVSPPTIALLNVEAGKAARREVWVLNNYNEDFEVESTSSQQGSIKVLKQERNGNRYSFDLEITPPAQGAGNAVFTDEFYVKIKGDETLKVVCRGFYKR